MKKFIVLLLALVLFAPTAIYACDCCSPTNLNLGQSAYENFSHQCCTALNIQKDSCRIQNATEFLPASQTVFTSPFFSAAKSASISTLADFAVRELGPPGFSSHIPIYLADRTLRI